MHHSRRGRPWHYNSRQHVLLEYANLKDACPEGIYLSLTPGNPTRWSGVLFVRKGHYAPTILRFLVSFPSGYPGSPPLVTFVTDIFHPLITPLTTYTYTTGSLTSDPVSATDEDRLPPGGFALSDAFPHWFGRSKQSALSSVKSSRNVSSSHDRDISTEHGRPTSQETGRRPPSDPEGPRTSIIGVLDYVKRAFDDDELLDGLPLEAAVNLGAWKAWRAHRRDVLQQVGNSQRSNEQISMARKHNAGHGLQRETRRPDEWSWDGVWKERVKKGVDASISDQILFGHGDDTIRFIDMNEDAVREIKEIIYNIVP